MKKPSKKGVAKKAAETQALHVQNGDQHIVGLEALRVLLTKDGDSWFAQGLEIDYAAAGDTIDDVKSNFEAGLRFTVREHLKMHGHIKNVLKVADQDAWAEFLNAKASEDCLKQRFTTIQVHSIVVKKEEIKIPRLPFKEIAFLEMPAAAA